MTLVGFLRAKGAERDRIAGRLGGRDAVLPAESRLAAKRIG